MKNLLVHLLKPYIFSFLKEKKKTTQIKLPLVSTVPPLLQNKIKVKTLKKQSVNILRKYGNYVIDVYNLCITIPKLPSI